MNNTKLELLIIALTAQLGREPTEDELFEFIRGDSEARIKIWNGVK